MASVSFNGLLIHLPMDREYLIPDLPGFAFSRNGFTDFSFPAHTEALRQLLDAEHIESAHVVAYSQGGGPVLGLVDAEPGRFLSLNMLSAIGVQEYELTGDYFLNHLLHGLQYYALEIVRWGVPHFGLLDDFLLNTHYAKNFLQSDMRPLRGKLERLTLPVLITHGTKDFLIPPIAAEEHFRIVPQSQIRWFPGGHGYLFTQPQETATVLTDFWERVENGRGVTHSEALPERISAAAVPFDRVHHMALADSALRFVLGLIAIATLLSEDLACIVAGLLAARGLISIPQAVGAALVGIFAGDIGLYVMGRLGGDWLRKIPIARKLLPDAALLAARNWLGRDGWKAVIGSRFLPGARLPTYVAAGVVRAPFGKMLLWFGGASVLWTVPVVTLLALFGKEMSAWLMGAGKWLLPLTVLTIVALWLLLRALPKIFTHRGRRIFLGKWRRFTRWEFWPLWAVYTPVILAIVWMGLRRGRLTWFTAANPAMPHSGVVGESKADILEKLTASGSVARFLVIDSASDREKIATWQQSLEKPWPLVVKPDVGERGTGVSILHDATALTAELDRRPERTLLQEYIGGEEFGIFYIRKPSANRSSIFSITIKKMTAVTGDGQSSLEDLILNDDRAVCMERLFRERFRDRLASIPANEEKLPLTQIGSHCRGAMFLNGQKLLSPALEAEIERIARTMNGFYLGRFDVRCPSEEALQRGEGIRVLELNGITSEATHIYHPGASLLVGWKTLIEQWRLAIEIGQANAKAGAKVTSLRELLRIIRRV